MTVALEKSPLLCFEFNNTPQVRTDGRKSLELLVRGSNHYDRSSVEPDDLGAIHLNIVYSTRGDGLENLFASQRRAHKFGDCKKEG